MMAVAGRVVMVVGVGFDIVGMIGWWDSEERLRWRARS